MSGYAYNPNSHSLGLLHLVNSDRRQFPLHPGLAANNTPHPDLLLDQLPLQDTAVTDFNKVGDPHRPPYREIPSALIATLLNPRLHSQQPDWRFHLTYFFTSHANHGIENLADLYIFMTRIALPNAIVDNRRLLLDMYLTKPDTPAAFPLRYDAFPFPPSDRYVPPATEPSANRPLNHAPRPILRSHLTPDGARFVAWLQIPINIPPTRDRAPEQTNHRASGIDGYLNEDESVVRRLKPDVLYNRTYKVLQIWWWITGANAQLGELRDGAWEALERYY